jgi:hypothetical protein
MENFPGAQVPLENYIKLMAKPEKLLKESN